MSYIIESEKITAFLDNTRIRLPRFQRKSTWNKKQNFELCISVFQDYPVGVVILNEMQNTLWLLDGRQRREALIAMRNNPVVLYDWAKNYLGFKATADQNDITNAYWSKVDRFLQTDIDRTEKKDGDSSNDNNYYGGEEEEIEVEDYSSKQKSFDSSRQREGLTTLLKLILMVHQVKNDGSRWEKLFDFKAYIKKLRYAQSAGKGRIDPEALRKFLHDLNEEIRRKYDDNLTSENFIKIYADNFYIEDEDGFEKCVEQKWSQIQESLETLKEADNIFESEKIGIIHLTNASPLDAQNIFSRINGGGTKLKAEELLSAKPFWNKPINNPSASLREAVKKLYSSLEINTIDNVCRWDVAATLISRIHDQKIIFDSYEEAKAKNEVSLDEITLGFKLLSSIIAGGMSNKKVIELETDGKVDWEEQIDEIISDIDSVCKLMLNSPFFKFFQSWKKPIAKLLGNAIALEFISIMLLDWKDKGCPTGGGNYKAVQRDAKILFDKLVFEYATRAWRGSGDTKMAKDIKNWKDRLICVDESSWKIFIEGASEGKYNGQVTTKKTLGPVLYYYYVLKKIAPTIDSETKIEIDHIVPEEKFQGNNGVDQALKDSLINFALLPKKDNISKSSKALNEITNDWLKEEVSKFSEIPQSDFAKYSDITNIDEMKEMRREKFLEAFSSIRNSELSN